MGVKVRERPVDSGIWWIFIDHQGDRKAKKIGKDKRLAVEAARKIEAKLTLGDLGVIEDKPKPALFKEYAELWLEGYIKPLRRDTTYERYHSILERHVFPVFGKVPIDELKRSDIRNLLMTLLKKGVSWGTACLVRDVISGPMVHALDDELITANPVSGIFKRINAPRNLKREIDPFKHEEVALFLEACAKYYPEHYPFFLTAFRTGMRLGELLALQWRDVDWHGKFILVRRSYKRGRIDHTKTGKQRRVDMSNQLIEALREFQLTRKKEALESGTGKVEEFIYHRNGKPIAQNSIRYPFKRNLEKAGLREIRFHDIRHTYASLLFSDGASPVFVKEQMGHSSIQITVDIYGHLIPNSNRDMVNRLDSQPSATYPQPAKMEKA